MTNEEVKNKRRTLLIAGVIVLFLAIVEAIIFGFLSFGYFDGINDPLTFAVVCFFLMLHTGAGAYLLGMCSGVEWAKGDKS